MPHLIIILFVFALGACVGSFLNVVVWRMPRGESLVSPPSHCPKCNNPLKWYDNLPVIGWLKLQGRCRFCREPISPRYPIVEAVTGLMFAFYYVMFFVLHIGPCVAPGDVSGHGHGRPLNVLEDWPLYGLYMVLLSGLLAASLIDAELFEIPIDILWSWKGGIVWVALLVHALWDTPAAPGNLIAGPMTAAVALGGTVGLLISVALLYTGRLPRSFPQGGPLLEVERAARQKDLEEAARRGASASAAVLEDEPPEFTAAQIRVEMGKEMLFLLPPLALAGVWLVLTIRIGSLEQSWSALVETRWVAALLGSLFGGLIGGFVVWMTRILGSLGFGREAMGMGDVHLMAGIGAVIGAGAATISFFLAPFFGILVVLYMLATGTRRELPYGPYLSMATAFVMLFYCPIAAYLAPGLLGLAELAAQLFGFGPSN